MKIVSPALVKHFSAETLRVYQLCSRRLLIKRSQTFEFRLRELNFLGLRSRCGFSTCFKENFQVLRPMKHDTGKTHTPLLWLTITVRMRLSFFPPGLRAGLLFTRKTRKLWLENEMVHTIPFETFSEIIGYRLNQCIFSFPFELIHFLIFPLSV